MNILQRAVKRSFDLAVASAGLTVLGGPISLFWLAATIDTGQNGFFTQERVGKDSKIFSVIKLRSMRNSAVISTTVTTKDDPRITPLGKIFRRFKIDELPQLINVALGQMSLVGPRPDVPGYANDLSGDDRVILNVRPGITGPATLAFRNEEQLLAKAEDPERFNDEVIYPEKVRINREYVENYSMKRDVQYIVATVIPWTAQLFGVAAYDGAAE